MTKMASVIIPTFNCANLLMRALDSAYVQSYRPIEILVIDDGSTDDTPALVKQWREEHISSSFTLHYFRKENGGPASSRNAGLSNAKGDYIYFLDSDDYMHDNLLTEAVGVIEKEGSDCVIFGFHFIRTKGIGLYLPPINLSPLESFLLGYLWGYTPTIVRKAELARKVGPWNEDLRIAEDYEYLGRTLLASKKTSILTKHLLTIQRGEESLSFLKDSMMGLENRLIAESTIVGLLAMRKDMSPPLLRGYANRLFKTAINMHTRKEPDFATRLGLLALRIDRDPWGSLEKSKRFVWKHRRILGPAWSNSAKVFSFLKRKIRIMNRK